MSQSSRIVPKDVEELLTPLRVAKQNGDRIGEGWALANIGRYYRLHDSPVDAMKHYNMAIEIFYELDDIEGGAWVLREQGQVAISQQLYDEAENCLSRALGLHQQLNSLHEQAYDLLELGNLARHRKQVDLAAHYLNNAVDMARQSGDNMVISYALHDLGVLENWRGNNQLGYHLLQQALPYSYQSEDQADTATILGDLGAIAVDLKDYGKANEYLSSAILAFEAQDDRSGVAIVYLNFARLHQARGDLDAARAATIEGATTLRGLGSPLPQFGKDLITELGIK